MFSLQTADRLRTGWVERPPSRDARGEIAVLNIGLLLGNESRHLLGYEVVRVVAEVEGCSAGPPMAACEASGDIAAGATRVIDQGLALERPLQAGMVLRGTVQVVLDYGAPNRPRHRLELDFAISFKALSPREIAAFGWREV